MLQNVPDGKLGYGVEGEKYRLNWHVHISGNGNVSGLFQQMYFLVGSC
jgi:hypothetical protein